MFRTRKIQREKFKMYRHVFIGLLLVGFQLPCYNCVPGPVLSMQDLPMDLFLEDKHTGKH